MSRVNPLLISLVLVPALAVSTFQAPHRETAQSPTGAPEGVFFGAVGDGRADDTDALQRAVDSGVGDIRLPKGVYRITRPIVVDLDKVGYTSFHGGGVAKLVMAGPGPALKLIGTHGGTASPKTVREDVWLRQRTPMIDGLEIVGEHPEAFPSDMPMHPYSST